MTCAGTVAKDSGESPESKVPGLIQQLEEVDSALKANLEAQDAGWPDREREQLREAPPPPAVRLLQEKQRSLEADKGALRRDLEAEARRDLAPFWEYIERSSNASALETILPLALKEDHASDHAKKAVLGLVPRLAPCPLFLVRAVSDAGGPEGSELLLQLGKQTLSSTTLAASTRSGDSQVIAKLIDLADGESGPLSRACLDAVQRLEPPSRQTIAIPARKVLPGVGAAQGSDAEAVALQLSELPALNRRQTLEVMAGKIRTVRSESLKASLVICVGLFKDPESLGFLVSLYRGEKSDKIRLAALSAIGNMGPASGQFLLEELRQSGHSLELERALILAIGSSGNRGAMGELVQRLARPEIASVTARALRRLSGKSLEPSQALWARWLKSQPEFREQSPDPDET